MDELSIAINKGLVERVEVIARRQRRSAEQVMEEVLTKGVRWIEAGCWGAACACGDAMYGGLVDARLVEGRSMRTW